MRLVMHWAVAWLLAEQAMMMRHSAWYAKDSPTFPPLETVCYAA